MGDLAEKPKLLERLGERYHIDPAKMLPALKATAFRTRNGISDAQMIALLVVADQYKLNPWTKEIYAFPDKSGGIVPVVGVDGWSRIINSHPDFDGMEFVEAEEMIKNPEHKPCPEWVQCAIYRKDRSHPVSIREHLDECYRGLMGNPPKPGPWQTHTKRFLRHKAMIQCARLAFGFVGIFDPDEAERIIEAEIIEQEPKKALSVVSAVIAEEKIEVDESLATDYATALKDAIYEVDDTRIAELVEEMSADMTIVVHKKLSSEDRTYLDSLRGNTSDESAEQ